MSGPKKIKQFKKCIQRNIHTYITGRNSILFFHTRCQSYNKDKNLNNVIKNTILGTRNDKDNKRTVLQLCVCCLLQVYSHPLVGYERKNKNIIHLVLKSH